MEFVIGFAILVGLLAYAPTRTVLKWIGLGSGVLLTIFTVLAVIHNLNAG